jgi:hypothetical protein
LIIFIYGYNASTITTNVSGGLFGAKGLKGGSNAAIPALDGTDGTNGANGYLMQFSLG